MNSTLQLLQQQQQQQQQQQHHLQRVRKLEKLKSEARTVQSGKVYRQLFEAQVQLSEAYDKVKTKLTDISHDVVSKEDQIPLVRESRNVRGKGFLTHDAEKWLNAPPNEQFIQNPVFYKHKFEENKTKESVLKKKAEREDVLVLPDAVLPGSKGSNIEDRIKESRKKKHHESWEDMIQEISIINLNKEPEIRQTGKNVLIAIQEDDQEVESLLNELNEEDTILNGCSELFDEFKIRLLAHSEIRKDYIDQMDKSFTDIENDRVYKIRKIFSIYSDELFKISFLPRPQIEKLFDSEIQQLNNQILMNKSCYTQLYTKLTTSDIEREKNQVNMINDRFFEWRKYSLDKEITNLQTFVDELNMVDSKNETANFEQELQSEQKKLNENRIGLIESLNKFKPPESNKTAVYKWYESVREYSKKLDEINTNYVNKIQLNYEDSNQKIISRMEDTLKYLIENKIIDSNESKEILEQRLLPIWSKKQREIEEYIDTVESDFEEISQIVDKELSILFKYLQGITHIWDMHEIGLVKKERALQELLQDCRKDHDHDNHKREEKLDIIIDQMRQSSNEKDLKRLLSNVSIHLEAIKRGYFTFKESQIELVNQYPQMVNEELLKYQESVFKFFSIQIDPSKIIMEEDENAEIKKIESHSTHNHNPAIDSMRFILKEILNTDRGTKFYVSMRSPLENNSKNSERQKNESNQTNDDENDDLFTYDELIPNTKKELLSEIDSKQYLKHTFIGMDIVKNAKNVVRMNFLNHFESWKDEANERSGSIVVAKTAEIDKELELRLHLHEPRLKRTEMDVHNVRASELIIHEERVDRHCAGIEEEIENIKKQFNLIQSKMNDMATQNKSDILNYEMAFSNATKSSRLQALQDQLNRQRDKHMENIKTSLRNFRSKFDETLSYLRNSNAKFRFSFNIFSDNGNFSAEEVETHDKKLKKMAALIDTNETILLKEMERLEKKHLDEAVRLMAQFQDKFKYHLVDLQFIEKISRWLNDTQIKIKSEVNASNTQAKELNKTISEFETRLDACRKPNLDKIKTTPKNLLDFFDEINQSIYKRASYLKCYKDLNVVPLHFRSIQEQFDEKSLTNLAGSISTNRQNISMNLNLASSSGNHYGAESTHSASSLGQKSNRSVQISTNNILINKSTSKLNNEDPALTIIKNLLHTNAKQIENEPTEILIQKSQSSINPRTTTPSGKGGKTQKINTSRRTKTRDEMFAFYCVFGEQRHLGDDFKSNINNILRDSLEGVLTNSELFYRDVQAQNRHVTRPQSLKDTYADFAEAIIQKLKAYFTQCDTYHNQCIRDFRESLIKFEILTADFPELVINEIFTNNFQLLQNEMEQIKKKNSIIIEKFENEKNKNESLLKPNLGHPSMLPKLDQLNQIESKRQETNLKTINDFSKNLLSTINKNADNFFKDLARTNETLLIKFDDILTEDEILKHEVTAEKHVTSELIKRQKAGLSLEDPEPEPLIRREKGRWNGIQNFDDILMKEDNNKQGPFTSATINTAKTTLAHQKSTESIHEFHKKFKIILEENLNFVKANENEMKYKYEKWNTYWSNSINQIKQLYN